ncbi:MAG: TlyA family RNA methyltransferase [Pseudomonadota bacterium]
MTSKRLDQLLVDLNYYETRARARDAIKRGCVEVDGKCATKPAVAANADQVINITDDALFYVSRAALKLIHGLDVFSFNPNGEVCVDIGASTGGFSQVLLERGANRVFAVDVGHSQLAEPLRSNPNLINLEKLNARDLTRQHLDGQLPGLVVSDVSFISLKLALPPALALAKDGASCILLVKPQFEVGRSMVGKNGLVSSATAQQCAEDLRFWLDAMPGWTSKGLVQSPIKGGDGNQEYLLAGRKDG